MLNLTPELIQLGSTAVVSVVALWAIVEVVRTKKGHKKGQKNNSKFLKEIRDNHLSTMNTKIDGLIDYAKESADGQKRMIEILVEIKTILKRE